jgi:hypothetical protein
MQIPDADPGDQNRAEPCDADADADPQHCPSICLSCLPVLAMEVTVVNKLQIVRHNQ